MKIYYTYELIDPRNNKVFYVGKGTGRRMYDHYNIVKRGSYLHNIYLERKIKKLLKENLKPKYKKIFESEIEQECFNKEIERIKKLGRKNLCNLTDGGEGGVTHDISGKNNPMYGKSLSNEHKKKLIEANTGRKVSDIQKSKASKSMKKRFEMGLSDVSGKNNPMYGKKRPEWSKQMKENNPCKRDDVKEKIRQKAIGRKHSPETIEKMKISRRKYLENLNK